MLVAFISVALALQSPPSIQLTKGKVMIRAAREGYGWVEEIFTQDDKGQMKLVMASPRSSKVKKLPAIGASSALSMGHQGLFSAVPDWNFTDARSGGDMLSLRASFGDWRVDKTLRLRDNPYRVEVSVKVVNRSGPSRIHYLLDTYAFVPNGNGTKPTRTTAPGLRPEPGLVIGDHFFRSPAVIAERDGLWAAIVPSTASLSKNRPIPAILELDADNGVVDATLLGYGLCDHRLAGHVSYRTDPSMTREVPAELKLDYDLLVGTGSAAESVTTYLWERDGRAFFDRVLPQAMPFINYAKTCYTAAFKEQEGGKQLGWFEHKIGDYDCAGVPAGWGYTRGWVSWQCWFNNLRSAYGVYAWGNRSFTPAYKERGAKMLNLALAAPLDKGACPTTYDSEKREWIGCLIKPSPECYYDLPSMAWKGYWLLRFIQDFADCPRKEDALSYAKAMADCMLSVQRADGAIPSWLTRDHKVVPILDASAQTALPAWFLAELYGVTKDRKYFEAAERACTFLVKEVIPQGRYYDFETFFSCSPKACLQIDGKVDNAEMHDPHTLCPPQNTLAMQWAAEAIRCYVNQGGDRNLMGYSFQALNDMMLYQATWNISYRKVAYTFGGFSVQNSDGEYLDARQAQFGATLCDFGAQFGRRDWFERGVAAVRAGFTLINHPLHIGNELYPNPNYPLGLQPENCGHSGWDSQNGRTGFDWGEGSALTSAAYILDRYGDVFVHEDAGWSVGIDGVRSLDAKGSEIEATMWRNLVPWTGTLRMRVVSSAGKVREGVEPKFPRAIRTIDVDIEGDQAIFIAVPAFQVKEGTSLTGRFYLAGMELPAELGPRGFTAKYPLKQIPSEVSFEGTIGDEKIERFTSNVLIDPTFDFADWRMPGWSIRANFPEVPTRSKRRDFNPGSPAFIGTCEDGRGGYDDSYIGEVKSPPFVISKSKMILRVGGGSGSNVRVELLDERGIPQMVARGKNDERMADVVWDVSGFRGKTMRIQVVDHETGPWGHINLGLVRFSD